MKGGKKLSDAVVFADVQREVGGGLAAYVQGSRTSPFPWGVMGQSWKPAGTLASGVPPTREGPNPSQGLKEVATAESGTQRHHMHSLCTVQHQGDRFEQTETFSVYRLGWSLSRESTASTFSDQRKENE